MRQHINFLFITACSLLLSACMLTQPVKVAQMKRYSLDQVSLRQFRGNQQQPLKTILVSIPTAGPGYQTNAIVYQTQPYHLQHYAHHQWVADPAHMLLPLIVQSLTNSGHYLAVLAPPFAGTTDLRLDTQLVALKQQYLQGNQENRVVLLLSAELINNQTGHVIASREFSASIAGSQAGPYAAVLGANRATRNVLSQLTTFTVDLGKSPATKRYVKATHQLPKPTGWS